MKIKIKPSEMKAGLKAEREHDDVTHGNMEIVKKIAMAHLKEDPHYYKKLKKAGL